MLLGLDSSLADAVLKAHSSNLSHLRTDPLRVLIRSAFWVDSYGLLPWIILLAVVLAPAERWLGTKRWLIVFITGHVGATLLAALGLWMAIGAGLVSRSLESSIDVGVSYGFAAVAAVFTYRLTGRLRTGWALAVVAIVIGGVLIGHTFTDFGHLIAVAIGFAMWPLTRARSRSLPAGARAPRAIWFNELSGHSPAGTVSSLGTPVWGDDVPGLQLQPGVETLTITGATPGGRLRVCDDGGRPLATLVADERGQAHLSFLPPEHRLLATADDLVDALRDGHVLAPGAYLVIDESASPEVTHGPVTVLAVDDHPDPSTYDQELAPGFGYVTVRDGVQLSIMVRFPNQDLYGPAPWPTVIEYSGYGPSNPDVPQPGTLLANLLGFAVVGVNMRGTGCSGGVFDVFSPAQSADGYDVVETVARQPWVLHGRPGMVGLSYPGISQLHVASTRPPSLAAITPLSVIDDLWRQQWPGGTYNSGFTRSWLAQRDAETSVGGQAWDQARIDAGDHIAAANQEIRTQNFDFERFGRAIENFRPSLEARRVATVIDRINVPVYLTGAWQDEQTGSRFALMLDQFHSSPHVLFTLFNGHHPDGYSPMVISRWFEFLSFHVARRVPIVPELIRMFAPAQFAEHFGLARELEPDRFADLADDFDAAFEQYLAEPPVRILFESGAGSQVAGAAAHRYEASTTAFPPPDVHVQRWWFTGDDTLEPQVPEAGGAHRYLDDPDSGDDSYATIVDLNDFTQPTVDITWQPFGDEHSVAYETAPLEAPLTVAGQGHVDLWFRPGTEDTSVQATLTEIRADGIEVRVQCGWHRPIHGFEDGARSDDVRVDYTFAPEHRRPLPVGEWVRFRIPLMPVVHVFRAGSRLRLAITTPGRDMPLWNFESPVEAGAGHEVGFGGARASSLVLPVWDDVEHPEDYPPVGSLRGQPDRPARPITNQRVP